MYDYVRALYTAVWYIVCMPVYTFVWALTISILYYNCVRYDLFSCIFYCCWCCCWFLFFCYCAIYYLCVYKGWTASLLFAVHFLIFIFIYKILSKFNDYQFFVFICKFNENITWFIKYQNSNYFILTLIFIFFFSFRFNMSYFVLSSSPVKNNYSNLKSNFLFERIQYDFSQNL